MKTKVQFMPRENAYTCYSPQKTNKLYLYKIQHCRSSRQVILFPKREKEKNGSTEGSK